jgi:pimeloyl-ACP methyl ester carboxylesterase
LSDEFTVVAWDVPGAGRSSDPPDSFTLPDYAECLAGSPVALACAADQRDVLPEVHVPTLLLYGDEDGRATH